MMESSAATGIFESPIPAQAREHRNVIGHEEYSPLWEHPP